MSNRYPYNRGSGFIKGILAVAGLAAFSLCVALLWQTFVSQTDATGIVDEPTESSTTTTPSPSATASPTVESTPSPAISATQTPAPSPEMNTEVTPPAPTTGASASSPTLTDVNALTTPSSTTSTAVDATPEQLDSDRVTSDYFNDAVFFGDSITTGIELYRIMEGTTVIAHKGINLFNVDSREVIETADGSMITMVEALKRTTPGKIYILIGANSITASENETALTHYESLLTDIKDNHPDAIIYVQSVLPVNEAIFSVEYGSNVTNAHIDSFNERLEVIVDDLELHYLDLSPVFKDENGELNPTPDGLHINSSQYIAWMDFLKENTVEGN